MTASNVPTNPISQLVARALRDSDLHSKLLADPKKTLLEMQIEVAPEQTVTVLESNEKRSFFVLPIMTDSDVKELKISLDSVHPNRLARSRILIQAAEDPSYRKRLFEDPKATLKSAGMTISDTTCITVLENSADHLYIVIPSVHHRPHQHLNHRH